MRRRERSALALASEPQGARWGTVLGWLSAPSGVAACLLLAFALTLSAACGPDEQRATCAAGCRKFDRLCGARDGLSECESECNEELSDQGTRMQEALDCLMSLPSCDLGRCGLKDEEKDFELDKGGVNGGETATGSQSSPGSQSGPGSQSANGASACEGVDPGCRATASPLLTMISDLEESTRTNATWSTVGDWFFSTSPSSAGDVSATSPASSCGGAEGTCSAMCVSGALAGANYPWITLGLSANGGRAWSVSSYTGASFWIKASHGATSRLTFNAATRETLDTVSGGTCATDCFDFHDVALQASAGWRRESIPFSALQQGGWGTPAAWEPTHVVNLGWTIESMTETTSIEGFTLCVDNVSVY